MAARERACGAGHGVGGHARDEVVDTHNVHRSIWVSKERECSY